MAGFVSTPEIEHLRAEIEAATLELHQADKAFREATQRRDEVCREYQTALNAWGDADARRNRVKRQLSEAVQAEEFRQRAVESVLRSAAIAGTKVREATA